MARRLTYDRAGNVTGDETLPDPPAPPDRDFYGELLLALALTTLAEFNALRSWLADFKTQVAAATTLADLKARVATLPATPDRTRMQLLNALKARLTDGSLDG